MRILIVKLSAFGDIIHALPAASDLLARPQVAAVHWLLDTRYAFASEILPQQVKVHEVDLKGDHPLQAAWETVRRLRGERFDAVLDLQGLLKSGLIARAVSSRAYGFDARLSPEKGNAWLVQPVRFHDQERHVVQQYRRIAAAPFVQDCRQTPAVPLANVPPRVACNSGMRRAGQRMQRELAIKEGGYVVLHVGGGWQTKRLPENIWRQVAAGVCQRGLMPVFSWGTPAEKQLADALAAAGRGIALPRRLNMSPLCGLLAMARAVIGADTGVLHLAAALDAPTATYWGPSASWRSAPLAAGNVWAESDAACRPCFKRSCRQFICMGRIQADDLLEVLDGGEH